MSEPNLTTKKPNISYLAVKDAAVILVLFGGMHIYSEECDLGVLAVAGALGLAKVPGVDDSGELVERLHFDGHDAGPAGGGDDGREVGIRFG